MAKMTRNYFVAYKMGEECGWSVIATDRPVRTAKELFDIQNTVRALQLEKGYDDAVVEKLILTNIQLLESEEKPCLITKN